MRDGWRVYEWGVKGKVQVMRKGYREGIEGDKVNVREEVGGVGGKWVWL